VYLSEKRIASVLKKHPGFNPDKARSWFNINPLVCPLQIIFNRMAILDDLNTLMDDTLNSLGLKDENLVVFGFSQGGITALYTAFRRASACRAVVCHSGGYMGMSTPESKPETLMIVGDRDDFYDCKKLTAFERHFLKHDRSMDRLQKSGIPATEHIVEGLGHNMTKESMKAVQHFLESRPAPSAS
jgi:predicted esterase